MDNKGILIMFQEYNFDCDVLSIIHRKNVFMYLCRVVPLRKLVHVINRDCLSLENENFQQKNFDIFLIFTQNIDFGYTLEPPRRGGSNEYPQSMFWSKNKKNRYTPAYPSFAI